MRNLWRLLQGCLLVTLSLSGVAFATPPGGPAPIRLPVLAGPLRTLVCPFAAEQIRFSPDGQYLLATGPHQAGLVLLSVSSGDAAPVRELTRDPGAGVGALWDPSGRAVLWRSRPAAGPSQLFRIELAGGEPELLATAPQLGLPDLLPDGRLAVTRGAELLAFSLEAPRATTPTILATHVQGHRIAVLGRHPAAIYVDHGRFILRTLAVTDWKPTRTVVTRGDGFFLGDVAPDRQRVVVQESRGPQGYIHVIEEQDGAIPGRTARVRELGPGHEATWLGPRTLVYAELEHDHYRFVRADLWALDVESGQRQSLVLSTDGLEHAPTSDAAGRRLAWIDRRDGGIRWAELEWRTLP